MSTAARTGLIGGLAGGGLVIGSLVVVAGGQAGTDTTIPPTRWLGLLSATGYLPGRNPTWGFVFVTSAAALVVLWIAALNAVAAGRLGERAVAAMAGLWALPFVVGPPLISKDVYSYAGHGLLLRNGVDVYTEGASALSGLHTADADRALAAIDPIWDHTPSPYGPLTSALERFAAQLAGGDPVGTVVALRIAALLAVVALVWLAAELAGGRHAPHRTFVDLGPVRERRRALAVATLGLNPLVLIHAVSAAHVEALMGALLVGGLLAAARRRWTVAVLIISAAGAVKAPAFAALPALLVVHSIAVGPARRWRALVTDVAVAVGSSVVFALAVPHGTGWLHNLTTPTKSASPLSLSTSLGKPLAHLLPGSLADDTLKAVQLLALAIAAAVVLWLAYTAAARPLGESVGYGLLAIVALGPVIYPWYLLWAVVCLLPLAEDVGLDRLVALSGVVTLFATVGRPSWTDPIVLVLALGAAAAWLLTRRRKAA